MLQYQIVSIRLEAARITHVGLLLHEALPCPAGVPGQTYETVAFLPVEEAIELLKRPEYRLYTVTAEGRRTEVRAYPKDNPTELRSVPDDTKTDNLRSLPVFQPNELAGQDAEDWVAAALK